MVESVHFVRFVSTTHDANPREHHFCKLTAAAFALRFIVVLPGAYSCGSTLPFILNEMPPQDTVERTNEQTNK